MVHIRREAKKLIETKVVQINGNLADESDGLPAVSLSCGVSFGRGNSAEEMFRQADLALYYVKEHGRDGCCFYSEMLKGKGKPEPGVGTKQ